MDKMRKKNWKLAAGILLIVQLLLAFVTIGIIIWLDLLPVVYLLLISLVLLWLVTVVYYFCYSGIKKELPREKKKKRLYIKRSVGCTISALVMVFCVAISSMLVQAGNTLNRISDQAIMTDTVSVYVLKENPAQDMLDAKDYVFAVTENFDYDKTKTTIEEINTQVGKTIQTQSFETILDMVDALYEGSVGAMILNVAYVDLIESQEDYEDFSLKTKTLFDHETEVLVENQVETQNKDITKDSFIVYISGSDTRNSSLTGNTRSDVNGYLDALNIK